MSISLDEINISIIIKNNKKIKIKIERKKEYKKEKEKLLGKHEFKSSLIFH